MNRKHSYAVADYKKLCSLAEVDDLVSVEEEFWNLVFDPTKKQATELIENAIWLWFNEHGVVDGSEQILKKWNLID